MRPVRSGVKAGAAAWLAGALLAGAVGCERGAEPWVLPQPDSVAAWYGEGTEASISGNVLEIRGTVDPEFLRRGGSLWVQSSPYFYLFNVQVRQLIERYPDLAAVRAVTYGPGGRELARATLPTRELNEFGWREALARASLAQREGTENLRLIAELIRFGEDHTEYRYAD